LTRFAARSVRLTRIDELYRGQHFFLRADDECFFLDEYTPGAGYAHSATNDLISNFKKTMDRQDSPEWHHKRQAILAAAALLARALTREWLEGATLVPVPPSAARGDALYDPRMSEALQELSRAAGLPLDVRELLVQSQSTRSSSRSGATRLSLDEIRAVYRIDESRTAPPPCRIALFDDLLTSGAHFRVAKDLLQHRFPAAPVTGIFLARSVHA
jgi:hypothetical protein